MHNKVVWLVAIVLAAVVVSSFFPVQDTAAIRPTPTAPGFPTPTPLYVYLPVVSNGPCGPTATPGRPTPTPPRATPTALAH